MERSQRETDSGKQLMMSKKGGMTQLSKTTKQSNNTTEEEKCIRKKDKIQEKKVTQKKIQRRPVSPKSGKKAPSKKGKKGKTSNPKELTLEESYKTREPDRNEIDIESFASNNRAVNPDHLMKIDQFQPKRLNPEELEQMTKDQVIVRKYSDETKDDWAGKFAELLIKSPQDFKFEDDDDVNECVICFDPIDNGEPLKSLPCTHRFHEDCIDDWFDKKERCPVCNFNFKTNGDESDDSHEDDDDWFNT